MAKKKSGKRIGLPTGMNLAQYIAFESARKSMIANKEAIIYHANLMTQRALWMCVVAIHDAYGYGQKNINKFLNQMNAVQEEYVQMVEDGDEEYADECIRAFWYRYRVSGGNSKRDSGRCFSVKSRRRKR